MPIFRRAITTLIATIWISAPFVWSADDAARLKRRPGEFAIIFNMGYAGDAFPRDPAGFEKLIRAIKAAHYNVVLCQYEDWRAEICEKHGVKMMVDLLVPDHHVYKNVEGVEKLCGSLRDSVGIYGYHLWSDRIGGTIAGRSRDVANVHKWDPNHATYVGGYNGRAVGDLQDADIIGYYDFHWTRGGFWRHLQRMTDAAKKTDSIFLKYTDGAPGKVGVGNYNRVLYTVSMSVAFGLKGYMFHHTGGEIDKATWEWKTLGEDLARVNAEIAPLRSEIVKMGNPSAVYSTPITKTAKDRETGEAGPTVPGELEAIPEDMWFRVTGGEAVVGVFKDGDGRDALVFANHNAYQPQEMRVKLGAGAKALNQFDRGAGKWKELEFPKGELGFVIPPAALEVIRVER